MLYIEKQNSFSQIDAVMLVRPLVYSEISKCVTIFKNLHHNFQK